MKIITVTLASLLISGIAAAHDVNSSTSTQSTSTPVYSGSSSVPVGGNTMNDRDKMLEACRSVRTDKNCDEIIQACQNQMDHQACVHNYMRK